MIVAKVRSLIQRRLVQNATFLVALKALDHLLPLIVIPYLARVLGPGGWGLVTVAQSMAVFVFLTVQFGAEFSGTRAVAHTRSRPDTLAEVVFGTLALQLLLTLLALCATLVAQREVPAFGASAALPWAAALFAIINGLNPYWYFLGQERLGRAVLLSVAGRLITVLAIFLLVGSPGDEWRVLASYAVGALVSTAGTWILLLGEVRPGPVSWGLIRRMFSTGLDVFLARVATEAHTGGNFLLLGLLVAPQQVAMFAAGDKLCRPLAWLLQPVNAAVLPRLSVLVREDPGRAHRLASASILLMAAGATLVVLAIVLAAPALVELVFGAGYRDSVAVVRVMAAIVPLMVVNAALSTQWMIPHGLDRSLRTVVLSAALLNVLLVLVLTPRFGALGMAWIAVAVEGCIVLGLLWTLKRRGISPWSFARTTGD